jgi:ABC-type nitrate/sulfonate/bicarbonate transport system substrate-binding protein
MRPAGALLSALWLVGCVGASTPPAATSASASTPEPYKLEVPYTPVTGATLPFWIALEQGFFAQQGLDVDAQFISGSGPIFQAMTSGQFPIGIAGGGDVVLNRLAGGDLLMIGAHLSTFTIEAWASPEIKAIADLKGKTVVVTRLGNSTHFAAIFMLRSAGLTPDDVAFLQSGGNAETVAILLSGNADAGMVGYPDLLLAKQAGYHKLPYLPADGQSLFPTAVIVARGAWLEDPGNRAIAANFLRAMDQGLQLARTDVALGTRVLRKYTKTEDEASLRETFDYYSQYFPRSLKVDENSIQNTLQVIDDPRAKAADPRQFFDNRLIDEMERDKH